MQVISLEMLDQKGDHVGSVAEVMLDVTSGRIVAVSLLVDDRVGCEPQMVVIPWESVRFDAKCDCFRLVSIPGNGGSIGTVIH